MKPDPSLPWVEWLARQTVAKLGGNSVVVAISVPTVAVLCTWLRIHFEETWSICVLEARKVRLFGLRLCSMHTHCQDTSDFLHYVSTAGKAYLGTMSCVWYIHHSTLWADTKFSNI